MGMVEEPAPPFPDGIDASHIGPFGRLRAHASPLAVVLLGSLLALAMTGTLGGAPAPRTLIHAPSADLQIKLARPLRSGLFFETHVRVVARRNIAKPVLGVDAALWRDLTINSQVPAASDERFEDGQYRFAYPSMKAGDTLEIKIDGQTNPPLVGRLDGSVDLLDGKTRLAGTHLSIAVLP